MCFLLVVLKALMLLQTPYYGLYSYSPLDTLQRHEKCGDELLAELVPATPQVIPNRYFPFYLFTLLKTISIILCVLKILLVIIYWWNKMILLNPKAFINTTIAMLLQMMT